jgi:hypothetical protein
MFTNSNLDNETIFALYEKTQFLNQLKTLKFFCLYKGAQNAYLADTDQLEVHFSYESRDQLFILSSLLNVTLRVLKPDEPRIELGKPYPKDIVDKLPRPTSKFNDIAQPGIQIVNFESTYFFIHNKHVSLSIQNDKVDYWKVDEKDIASAKNLEIYFEKKGLANYITSSEQQGDFRYISRSNYPGLFE